MPTLAEPRRYTTEELLALKDSPLVKKPDGLPPIEEWMGYDELYFLEDVDANS